MVSLSSSVVDPNSQRDVEAYGLPNDATLEEDAAPAFNAYFEDSELNEPQVDSAKKVPLWRTVTGHFRPYYILDHLTVKDTKVIFRSWAQLFSGLIFTAVTVISTWMGSAPYLLQIFGFIVASGGMSIGTCVYLQFGVFFGCVSGVLFSTIAMKINSRIHGDITIEELAESLIKEGVCEAGSKLQACIVQQIYTGRYLNVKVAAVTSIALITAKVFYGLLIQKGIFPKPTFIAGSISSVILLLYGVYWPVFSPLVLGYTVLKPFGISCALGIICSILFFPFSTNWQILNANLGVISLLKAENSNHIRLFSTLKPSMDNFSNFAHFKENVHSIKNKLAPLDLLAGVMKIDFSFGRFDRDDVNQIFLLVKSLVSVSAGFDYFYELFQERKEWATVDFSLSRRNSTATSNSASTNGGAKLFTTVYQSYKKVGEFERKKRAMLMRNRMRRPGNGNHLTMEDLDDIAEVIVTHCHPCLAETTEALSAIVQWITDANEFRTYSFFKYSSHVTKQKENAELLINTKQRLLDELDKLNDQAKLEKMVESIKGNEDILLFLVSQVAIFAYLLRSYCTHIVDVIDFLSGIDEKRPQPKLMTPFTKTKANDIPENIEEQKRVFKSRVQERDPESETPSRFYQKLGVYFIKFYKAISDRSLWYLIKSGGLVVASATPCFVRSTAHWYYENRLLWVAIMVMITDTELTGDSVYNFICRVFYTFVGCIVGIVAWYICQGNAYGYVTVAGAVFIYFIYYRHFSVHLTVLPSILFGVTTSLVLGTSYYNHLHPGLTDVGEGFHVGWLRLVSVTVGLTIGFLGCIIPRPHTSTSVHRRKLADLMSSTGELHCLVSKFACHRLENPEFRAVLKDYVVVDEFSRAFSKVAGVNAMMGSLKNELPLTGYWPEKTYTRLHSLLYDVIQLYYLLFALLNQVEDPQSWNTTILRRLGWSNSSILSILFANIHMSADALLTEKGLPKVTASNLSLKHLELLGQQWKADNVSWEANESDSEAQSEKEDEQKSEHSLDGKDTEEKPNRLSSSSNSSNHSDDSLDDSLDDSILSGDYADDPIQLRREDLELRHVTTRIQRSIIKNLDFDRLFSHDGQLSTTSLLLGHLIYERIDQMMLAVKSLVGEKFDVDMSSFDDFNETATLLG